MSNISENCCDNPNCEAWATVHMPVVAYGRKIDLYFCAEHARDEEGIAWAKGKALETLAFVAGFEAERRAWV